MSRRWQPGRVVVPLRRATAGPYPGSAAVFYAGEVVLGGGLIL